MYAYNNIHGYNNVEAGLGGIMFSTWTKTSHGFALLFVPIISETGRKKPQHILFVNWTLLF